MEGTTESFKAICKTMLSLKRMTTGFTIAYLVCAFLLPKSVPALAGVTLEEYGEGDKQFEVVEIGDKMIVYFHQRIIGNVIVEKDHVVYQFDKKSGELLDRRSHWREDLPEKLPQVTINGEHVRGMIETDIQSARMYFISPQSHVFPIKPCPKNPCWIVRSIKDGNMIITIIDAVSGRVLGNGIPPPYTAFSLTGPMYFAPCNLGWKSWAENAEAWFNTMGYPTVYTYWPTQNEVMSHVQSMETALFYELAHGGSDSFASGCTDGARLELTTAAEIEAWISAYEKMPFAFIGSCDGMCSTGDNTLSYEFRKGSTENTATIGYCGMSTQECDMCWTYSLDWQDDLFYYMSLGWSAKDAYDQANADYPFCASADCMRFAGDPTFAVVPAVQRIQGPCLIVPLYIDFGTIGAGCYMDTTFYIKNKDPDILHVDISESCDYYSIVAGDGPHTLAPGESLIVSVRYEPPAPGTHSCTIETGESSCSDVQCTGTADLGCLVEPSLLDFGSVVIGDSADLDFTIHNIGCGLLTGNITENCYHYSIVSGGGAYSLSPGDSVVVTVRFRSTNLGVIECNILTGTGCGNVHCQAVSIQPPPACIIGPDTLAFGSVAVGDFKLMTFNITNTGYGTLSGTVSDTCAYFDVINGAYELMHDQTHVVTIIFYPGVEGPHACPVETGNDACTDVHCTGYGGNAPVCLVQPDSLDFGAVIVGDSLDMKFDIMNTGGGILNGILSDTCSYYDVTAGAGSYGLAAGETLHVTVRFKPEAGGPFECTVETGAVGCSDVFCAGVGDDVSGADRLDTSRLYLCQNYPNPFNPTTSIIFTLPGQMQTRLSIYNVEGKLVKTLVNETLAGGVKTVTWNGTDTHDKAVSTGVYFYRLRAGGRVMTKKMILLK